MKKKLRNACAWLAAMLLIRLGLTNRAKKKAINGEFILSIYFHAPSKKLFEFCVKWLIKNDFHFLCQKDVYSIYKKEQPFPKRSVIITVDDGWQTNIENIVAIADKYKIPVAIFVSTEAVENGNFWWPYIEYATKMKMINQSVESLKKLPNKERGAIVNSVKKNIQLGRQAMTPEQIKNISASEYITIGSHTVTHPILTNCEDEQVYFELNTSRQKIEEWVKKEVVHFAYPNGDYGDREIKYLKDLGYILAYTIQPDYLTKQRLENIYQLPRFDIFENISNAEAICRMLGVWQSPLMKTFKGER